MAEFKLPKRLADKPAKLHDKVDGLFEMAKRTITKIHVEAEEMLERHRLALIGLEQRFEDFRKEVDGYRDAVYQAADADDIPELEELSGYSTVNYDSPLGFPVDDNPYLDALETAAGELGDLKEALVEQQQNAADAFAQAPTEYVTVPDEDED